MGLLQMLGGLFGKKPQDAAAAVGGAGGAMGGLGSLLGGLGGGGGSVLTALLPMLTGGGLGGILSSLQGGAHASKLSSWVGTGPNEAISPSEVGDVLGDKQVAQLATDSGVSQDDVKSHLSKLLPGIIDHLSPTGSLPTGSGLEAALGKLIASAGTS